MTTTLQDLKPSQIKPHKHNPRREVGDVTELADSIKAKGIVEPLIVAPNGTGTTFVLIAGHRRLAAAKAARLKSVPCLVRDDLDDERAQLETMLVENLQRTDLSPVEEAEAYQQLLEFPGVTQKQLAETTGRPARTISARLKLAKLGEATREKLHTGQLSLADATTLSEFADDPDKVAFLEKKIGWPDFAWSVENARRERKAKKEVASATRELEKAGVRVMTIADLAAHSTAVEEAEAADENAGTADLEAWLYVDDPDSETYGFEDVPMKPADHADCPGHAAMVDVIGQTFYVCLQPALHRDVLDDQREAGPAETDEQRAERVQRDEQLAARQQQARDLEVAATVRRRHLAAHLAEVGIAHGTQILRDAVLNRAGYNFEPLVDVLMPDRDVDERATEQMAASALTRVTSFDTLLGLLDVAAHANADAVLAAGTHGWPAGGSPHNTQRTAQWREELAEVWGYEWSDVEQRLLVQPGTEPAEES